MAQLILNHSSQYHRAIRTHGALPLTLRVGKFFLMFSMTFLIGLISFFYLVKFTEIHTKGYQLRKLEIERDRLETAREEKSTEISKLRALNTVRQSNIASAMVPAHKPVFIKEDEHVALLR